MLYCPSRLSLLCGRCCVVFIVVRSVLCGLHRAVGVLRSVFCGRCCVVFIVVRSVLCGLHRCAVGVLRSVFCGRCCVVFIVVRSVLCGLHRCAVGVLRSVFCGRCRVVGVLRSSSLSNQQTPCIPLGADKCRGRAVLLRRDRPSSRSLSVEFSSCKCIRLHSSF